MKFQMDGIFYEPYRKFRIECCLAFPVHMHVMFSVLRMLKDVASQSYSLDIALVIRGWWFFSSVGVTGSKSCFQDVDRFPMDYRKWLLYRGSGHEE